MPLTKTALKRYLLINECLSNPRKPYWTAEEIMEFAKARDIRMSKRTFNLDIQAMRFDKDLKYHAPIEYCKENKGFHYTEELYSIEKLPLSKEDIETFTLITELFKRFQGARLLNQVKGMLDKLEKVADQLTKKKTKLSYSPVLFEHVPYNKGIEHFDAVYQATIKQEPLLIHYKKFDHEKLKEYMFHPYLLKEYKFRWYLLGYNEKSKNKRILALDRMESVVYGKTSFIPYKGDDVEKYFDHAIGVTVNNSGVKEIQLWFTPSQGNYIKTQKLHESQQIINDTKYGLIITLQLIPNYELLQTLLAFGPEVKVLEPVSLKEEMKAMLEKSLRLYEE